MYCVFPWVLMNHCHRILHCRIGGFEPLFRLSLNDEVLKAQHSCSLSFVYALYNIWNWTEFSAICTVCVLLVKVCCCLEPHKYLWDWSEAADQDEHLANERTFKSRLCLLHFQEWSVFTSLFASRRQIIWERCRQHIQRTHTYRQADRGKDRQEKTNTQTM